MSPGSTAINASIASADSICVSACTALRRTEKISANLVRNRFLSVGTSLRSARAAIWSAITIANAPHAAW